MPTRTIGPPTFAHEPGVVVDSLLHPLAAMIRKLLSRSERQELGRILIDDEENILEALRAGVELERVFHAGGMTVSDTLRRRLAASVSIHEVAKRTGKKLFGNEKTARVFAIATVPPTRGLSSLANVAQDIVVLEDVGIVGNVGAIVRTSRALGAGALVLLNVDPVDVYDRRLIRASRGHVFALPIVTATTEELLQFCSGHRLSILVTRADAMTPVDAIASFPHRLAIAFGSEKRGCSRELMDAAAVQVQIPTHPGVESLNVSAAAGITLYQRLHVNRTSWPPRAQ